MTKTLAFFNCTKQRWKPKWLSQSPETFVGNGATRAFHPLIFPQFSLNKEGQTIPFKQDKRTQRFENGEGDVHLT